MKISDKFEHQIRRIHELIEKSDATVTWNDRIPDPDNPSQPRQIDITVLRENRLTIIECRIHNKRQDVKWIEELIGRRQSLRAQGVIAVSASGFTDGAIKKAKEFGVVLRHLVSLTRGEILSWGKSTKVTLIFYEFKNVSITFKVPSVKVKPSLIDEIMHHLQSDEINLYRLLESISNMLEFKDIKDKMAHLMTEVRLKKKITIENMDLEDFIFEAEVALLYKEVSVPSVIIYDSPNDGSLRGDVAIERFDLEDFEITQAFDDVTIALDLSTVESPPNSLFRIVDLEFTRKVHFKKMEILGVPKMKMFLSQLSLGIQSA